MHGRHAATFALAVLVAAGDIQRGAETAPPKSEEPRAEAGESARQAPAAPAKRSLEGEPASAEPLALESLQRIDLAAAVSNGEVTIEVNDPSAQPSVPALIDGDLANLLKTDSINPLVITLTFREPIRLRAARVHLAAPPTIGCSSRSRARDACSPPTCPSASGPRSACPLRSRPTWCAARS